MADIRKRTGSKGSTFQVRYADPSSATGFSYKSFATAKEARAFRESAKPVGENSKDLPVRIAVDEWLKICQIEGRDGKPPVSDATYRYYKYISDIIKSYSWGKTIQQLTKPDVVAFRSWLIENHGRTLAAKALTYFHGVLSEMATRDRVTFNAAADVRVRRETRYDNPIVIPTQREIEALLNAADALANSKHKQIAEAWERYRPMLYLAVDSGMRPQEYLAVAGYNLADGGIHVERAIDRGGKLSVTKTPAARRFIELSSETLAMVEHYRDNLAAPNDYDLVFPTRTGSWQLLNNWRLKGFNPALEKAGLMVEEEVNGKKVAVPRFTPYALRHYFASTLIADGEDIARIKTLMGHANISTTFDVYAHLIQRREDKKKERSGMISGLNRENSCGNSAASDI